MSFNKTKLVVAASLSVAAFIVGCGPQENSAPAPQGGSAPSAPAVAPAAADAPPPPPAAPEPPAPTPGAPAQAAPTVDAPTASPGTDPLFYFRRSEDGTRQLNDLEALQQAVDAYSKRAGISPDADTPALPNLKDLSDLVKAGLLKSLPAPPAGKKYVVDAKGIKVSLVNQ
ncbi:MAG: hypothetical protein AB1705_24910 [Verrucomicrobiota bacterium]